MRALRKLAYLLLALFVVSCGVMQGAPRMEPLDPASDSAALQNPAHSPLPEQWIWTARDAAVLRPDHAKFNYRTRQKKIDPHGFRKEFFVEKIPPTSTLYVAGPRAVKVYVNGRLVLDATADPQSPLATHVYRVEMHAALHVGKNLLALELVRGFGIVTASDVPAVQQLAFGEALAAKIVPATPGREAAPLVISDASWRSSTALATNWQMPEFDDRQWQRAQSLGGIEERIEFYQWNLDAGLYDWPGYVGMSPALRTYRLWPTAVTHADSAFFAHASALTRSDVHPRFGVKITRGVSTHPSLLLDFGREVAGRILFESACHCEAKIEVSYGESESEALSDEQYLGRNLVRVPAMSIARGPKSAFRYAALRFIDGDPITSFRNIRLEGIAYPVTYKGAFASSDPLLNRIWEVGAHTAHLCMQDGVWDAPKRDRGWWAGDLDVLAPVIGNAFGDSSLLDETLTHLIPAAGEHVNGIPGYTALWISALADLYQRTGDRRILATKQDALVAMVGAMDMEFDANGMLANQRHRWLFVDWAPDLFAYTPEAVEGTELEFVRGYRAAAWLLRELGDEAQFTHAAQRAEVVAAHARQRYADGVFGRRWQLNAMAVLAGVAPDEDYGAIWSRVLQQPATEAEPSQTISPYFGAYLLDAMARMDHRHEALAWMRTYWGGMLAEGATSFWEAYDLRWPKTDPHRFLQADGRTGFFVSMAHGWSTAPTAWLIEQVLGIRATAPGFRQATIRPDLVDLDWAKGQAPTPQGVIVVSAKKKAQLQINLSLPQGIDAKLSVPVRNPHAVVLVNGHIVATTLEENGTRATMHLREAGLYHITSR
jgi:alpha-L-rhamnosidase